MSDERRLVRVPIYDEVVNELFQGGAKVLTGLPDDATLRRTYRDASTDSWYFIFQSESFDRVGEGEILPEVTLDVATDDRLTHLVQSWGRRIEGESKDDEAAEGIAQCIAELSDVITRGVDS